MGVEQAAGGKRWAGLRRLQVANLSPKQFRSATST
jgi:hypothetical protein